MNLQENIQRIQEVMGLVLENDCLNCDERTLNTISKLSPELQVLAKKFVDAVKTKTNYNVTITGGLRTPEKQDKLYCKGRPKDSYCLQKNLPTGGKIVTYKKAGESSHNFGKAFDVYFNENGTINTHKPISKEISKIGKELGLEWGGDFQNFADNPHFQLPGSQIKKKLTESTLSSWFKRRFHLDELNDLIKDVKELIDYGTDSETAVYDGVREFIKEKKFSDIDEFGNDVSYWESYLKYEKPLVKYVKKELEI